MDSVAKSSRRKRRRVAFQVGIGVFLALGLWAFWIEPNSLVVRETTLIIPKWQKDANPLRIAILADLHVGAPYMNLDKVERVVDRTNRAKPDIIVLLGDYIVHGVIGGSYIAPDLVAAKLKKLRAPLGVYAVLGNHDGWQGGQNVRPALESAGISVLKNETFQIMHNKKPVWILGLADLWTDMPDVDRPLAKIPVGDSVIALTHNPDIFPKIPSRVSLTLAGHTHGGQVNLPIVGRLIVPSQFGQRYAIGHIVENGRHLFVSTGIGTSILPVRFRCPPEISIVTILANH